ncbi:MAG: thioesterase family protein [Comamonas sp.]
MNLPPVYFSTQVAIRFAHCDPAGIVFFPQYLVLFNGLVEDWFNDGLCYGYGRMLQAEQTGLPIVHLECDFRAIARMGDVLQLRLSVAHIGSRSLRLRVEALGSDGQLKVSALKVLVFTSLDTHQAMAVPPAIGAAIKGWMATVAVD